MNKTMLSPLHNIPTGVKTWKKCLLTLAATLALGTAHAADVNTTGLAVTDKTVTKDLMPSKLLISAINSIAFGREVWIIRVGNPSPFGLAMIAGNLLES